LNRERASNPTSRAQREQRVDLGALLLDRRDRRDLVRVVLAGLVAARALGHVEG